MHFAIKAGIDEDSLVDSSICSASHHTSPFGLLLEVFDLQSFVVDGPAVVGSAHACSACGSSCTMRPYFLNGYLSDNDGILVRRFYATHIGQTGHYSYKDWQG